MLAQKLMYERFGNDFLINFVSKGLVAAHCPQDLAEEYCQKLQVHSPFIELAMLLRTLCLTGSFGSMHWKFLLPFLIYNLIFQGNDMKSLKSFYQSLIEKLRVQQNGNLVFR